MLQPTTSLPFNMYILLPSASTVRYWMLRPMTSLPLNGHILLSSASTVRYWMRQPSLRSCSHRFVSHLRRINSCSPSLSSITPDAKLFLSSQRKVVLLLIHTSDCHFFGYGDIPPVLTSDLLLGTSHVCRIGLSNEVNFFFFFLFRCCCNSCQTVEPPISLKLLPLCKTLMPSDGETFFRNKPNEGEDRQRCTLHH